MDTSTRALIFSQSGDEIDESASGAAGGKGKADKSKKPKKKSGAKGEGQEVVKLLSALHNGLAFPVSYALLMDFVTFLPRL